MSLQARREPLPADYQYPTATCGCPSCASKLTPEPQRFFLGKIYGVVDPRTGETKCSRCTGSGPLEFGVCYRCSGLLPSRACPKCKGPSLRGDLCFNCTSGPLEPSAETPWGV